ncbi:GNAT family N-acetyltransferase [Actinomadura sp. 21ATH]|uniref:GNAT family N-acetyltransferase n=1 Tax=Actinomadura sp. 21ATH TaxID=1735444 RepID=UPI0035BF1DA5
MEDHLRLCPVREEDLATMDALVGDPDRAGAFTWTGFTDPRWRRRAWEENGLLSPDEGSLMVAAGEERLGFVQWRTRRHSRNSRCFELGIALVPEARGRGYGTRAQAMLARYLFAHYPVHRLEADTEAGNIAEQRALEKAGFTREGVLRECAWRDGAWRDGVLYSLLRTDPLPPG